MAISFEQFIDALKVAAKEQEGMYVNGPLSNGDYSIEFENIVKMIIFPNLQLRNGQIVMDFVCIPQGNSYDLVDTYDISEVMSAFLPGKDYLYDTSTIERSMSRTACIRFSINHEILRDIPNLIRTIEFMRDNTNIILQKQLEFA